MTKRIINTDKIREEVIRLTYQANFILPPDVEASIDSMIKGEQSPGAIETLKVLKENSLIARTEELPLCQDCGAVIIFIEMGQDISLEGAFIGDAVNDAVAEAYKKYYLRKSIVSDPLNRINTGSNTPAFVHCDLVPGTVFRLTVYLKGGGSENMTSLRMFRPTDPVEEILDHIEKVVVQAGPNPCPPVYLGVGLGGLADVAMVNAKKAVLRGVGTRHADPYYADLELKIMERLNKTNVGPLGFGGNSTVGGVFIKEAPAHIASLPVALNLNCHSLRFRTVEL